MSSAINSLGTSTSTAASGSTATGGINSMSASDFLNLMIQQLQQQDPLNPTDSNQLLTQMSEIGSLQSNTQLQQTLTQLGLQQTIGAGGNLIGKAVTGIDANGNHIQGNVTAISVSDQQVSLQLNTGSTLPMANVLSITAAAAATPISGSTTPTSTPTSGGIATPGPTTPTGVTSAVTSALGAALAKAAGANNTTTNTTGGLTNGTSNNSQMVTALSNLLSAASNKGS